MLEAAHQQVQVPLDETDDKESGIDDDESGQSQHAPRHSKSRGEISPQSLKYYEGSWQEALRMAKQRFRCYTILYNVFPVRDIHLPEATQIIARVVEDMKDPEGQNQIIFDPGA